MASRHTREASLFRTEILKAIHHFSWEDTILLEATLGEKQGKDQRDSKEQGAQGLKEDTRSLRHHGLVPFHLFFSPCKLTMTMSD